MKSQEFLDILGDVDEKFVLAADDHVVRPRFHWKPIAAAAACVALVCAAVWPRFGGGSNGSAAGMDSGPLADCAPAEHETADAIADEAGDAPTGVLMEAAGLHDYFLLEGEERRIMTTAGTWKASTEGVDDAAPAPVPNEGFGSGAFEDAPAEDMPQDVDGVVSPASGEVSPVDQEEAIRQYQDLLSNGGIGYAGEGYYPSWFGGAWLDNDWPDHVSRLTVAMVEGWDTEAMESMVRGWCGGTGDVLFCTVKYSYAHLNGLMDEISTLFDQFGWLNSGFSVNESANRIDLALFEMPGDELLAGLARLDPDGDAIRVQVFTDGALSIRFTEDAAAEPGEASDMLQAKYDVICGTDD